MCEIQSGCGNSSYPPHYLVAFSLWNCMLQFHKFEPFTTYLLSTFLCIHTGAYTHITSVGFCAGSLSCFGKIKKHILEVTVYSQYPIHYSHPEMNWLKYPFSVLFYSLKLSLWSCISHRLILAFFEVSELTWKYSCFSLLCKGLAVYIISDKQPVRHYWAQLGDRTHSRNQTG